MPEEIAERACAALCRLCEGQFGHEVLESSTAVVNLTVECLEANPEAPFVQLYGWRCVRTWLGVKAIFILHRF